MIRAGPELARLINHQGVNLKNPEEIIPKVARSDFTVLKVGQSGGSPKPGVSVFVKGNCPNIFIKKVFHSRKSVPGLTIEYPHPYVFKADPYLSCLRNGKLCN